MDSDASEKTATMNAPLLAVSRVELELSQPKIKEETEL